MKRIKKAINSYTKLILLPYNTHNFNAYVRGDFDLTKGFGE